MIRRYLSLLALLALARLAWRLLRAAAAVVILVAAAPVSAVAAAGFALSLRQGWPPRVLYRAAAWCLPMVGVWLVATAARAASWRQVVLAPYLTWLAAWREATAGSVPLAAVTIAPVAIPLGLLISGLAWSRRRYAMSTGTGGLTPTSPVVFDRRQWRRQVRSAKARIAAPGAAPLLTRGAAIVVGAVIRSTGHQDWPLATLPYQRLRSHQIIIGTTGTGKTALLLRLWAGFLSRGLQRHAAGRGKRPLLVVLDCKGGPDSRRIADRTRRVLREAGARATAIWPDEATLSLWTLPPDTLVTTLVDLVEHGAGGAAYYTDVMESIVALAIGAPAGPPASAAEFLARLDVGWLTLAYAAGRPEDAALLTAASRQITDIALRFRSVFRRLGPGLDGPGSFADADVWYCILEGTSQVPVAEAQARALVALLAHHTVDGPGADREILLAVDEFSAVSRRLPIWQLYERARSLGLAVQVSAQSWEGLADQDDDRRRIAGAAEGGIWLLRTPHPEPVVALAGEQGTVDTSRRVVGVPGWNHDGSSRIRTALVADPELIRRLDVGQAAYIHRGGVTFVQVKRLTAAPPALGRTTHAPDGQDGKDTAARAAASEPVVSPAAGATPPPAPPDASALLDEAFGREVR